jgi:bacterioferritin
MAVDPRTLGWLSRALNHEMAAVQQYLAQSVLARLWGDAELAQRLHGEALEELGHASLLIEQQIRLGVAPCAGQLPVSRLGQRAEDLLAHDRQLEANAVQIYGDALHHARRLRDEQTVALFEYLLREEREHLEKLGPTTPKGTNHG